MEIQPNEVEKIGGITGALVVALTGAAYGIQRFIKNWKGTSAEVTIIELMRKELERMAAQNKMLSEELNKLQLDLIKLNTELQLLTIENQRLHADVSEITKQLDSLRGLSSGENFE